MLYTVVVFQVHNIFDCNVYNVYYHFYLEKENLMEGERRESCRLAWTTYASSFMKATFSSVSRIGVMKHGWGTNATSHDGGGLSSLRDPLLSGRRNEH